MENVFASSLERLNSVEEQSMSKMEPSVVKHESSVRLVNFGKVLSAAAELAEDDVSFLGRIRVALCVDEAELLQKDYWALTKKMAESLDVVRVNTDPKLVKKLKWQGDEFGQAVDPGAGKMAKLTGQGSGLRFCIAQVCYTYLETGKVYDTKLLTACIHGTACRLNHNVPNAPVTAAQKAEFMSLAYMLGPERKAAVLEVMGKSTFSE